MLTYLFIMETLKKNQETTTASSFVPKLLNVLNFITKEEFENLPKFFTEAYLLLSDHEAFNDPTYRENWASCISYLQDLTETTKIKSNSDFVTEIKEANSVASITSDTTANHGSR